MRFPNKSPSRLGSRCRGHVLLVAVLAFTGIACAKPTASPKPLESSSPTASATPTVATIDSLPPTVPVSGAPPTGVTCPSGWSYFDNPWLHYSICYPSGWGFLDFDKASARLAIPKLELTELHLLSPDAFPWSVGTTILDAQRSRDAVEIVLNYSQGPPNLAYCEPLTPMDLSGLQAKYCEYSYEIGGPGKASDQTTVSPTGTLHAVGVVVGFRQPPLQDTSPAASQHNSDLGDDRLIVGINSTRSRFEKDSEFLWSIIRTIRFY